MSSSTVYAGLPLASPEDVTPDVAPQATARAAPQAVPGAVSLVERHQPVLWVDYDKGFSILLIVVFHVWNGLADAGIGKSAVADFVFFQALRPVRLPLFFFCAGLFLSRSIRRPFGEYVGDKLRGLAWPYVVWGLLQMGIALALAAASGEALSPASEISSWARGVYGQFWFLSTLLLATLLWGGLVKAGVSPAMLFVAATLMCLAEVDVQAGVLFLVRNWLPYIAAGALLGPYIVERISHLRIRWAMLIFLGGAAGVAVLGWMGLGYREDPPHPLASIFGITAGVGLAAVLARRDWCWPIRTAGKLSLQIFVLHILAAAGVRTVLLKLGVTQVWIHLPIGLLAGIGGPIAVALVADRLGLTYLFTLRAPRENQSVHPTFASPAPVAQT